MDNFLYFQWILFQLSCLQSRDIGTIPSQVDMLEETDRQICSLKVIFTELLIFSTIEELKTFCHMYATGNQIVIPAAQVIVDIHSK